MKLLSSAEKYSDSLEWHIEYTTKTPYM